jgi:hypothetical protein
MKTGYADCGPRRLLQRQIAAAKNSGVKKSGRSFWAVWNEPRQGMKNRYAKKTRTGQIVRGLAAGRRSSCSHQTAFFAIVACATIFGIGVTALGCSAYVMRLL